eukprot:7061300-Alexandrium_andersonii.AAC.1
MAREALDRRACMRADRLAGLRLRPPEGLALSRLRVALVPSGAPPAAFPDPAKGPQRPLLPACRGGLKVRGQSS